MHACLWGGMLVLVDFPSLAQIFKYSGAWGGVGCLPHFFWYRNGAFCVVGVWVMASILYFVCARGGGWRHFYRLFDVTPTAIYCTDGPLFGL